MSENIRSVDLSFEFCLAAFLAILGTLSLTLWAIIRYLLSSGENTAAEAGAAVTSPARKAPPPYYGTMDEEEISKPREERGFSSDDLYDGKICVICYEFQRNCFFTPCGHYVTCSLCAKRLMMTENKACPICRRLIHKARQMSPLQTVQVDEGSYRPLGTSTN